jgi:sulfopyruvate decarboxylase subunit beta
MKITEYTRVIASTIADDALIVSSHTLNVTAWTLTGAENPCLGDLNMGFATPVGLGLALALPHRKVIVLDSDGGALLFAGALTDLAAQAPPNLIVVIHDNESMLHFPSHTAGRTDLAAMARGAGMEHATTARTVDEFEKLFAEAYEREDLSYIVAKSERGRLAVPQDTIKPIGVEGTLAFVRRVEQLEGKDIIGRGWRISGFE